MKNCLVTVRNKKLIYQGEESQVLCDALYSCGYFFDRTLCVPFDSTDEITRALEECKRYYNNAVVICPTEMRMAVIEYVNRLYQNTCNESGILKYDKGIVCVVCEGVPSVEQIKQVFNQTFSLEKQPLYIKTVGASSEKISLAIQQAKQYCNDFQFRIFGEYDEKTIQILYDQTTPKFAVDSAMRAFASVLEGSIYALENVTLAERLFQLLKLRRMKIAVAESFTGGGICKRLVEVSGVSEVFYEGLNVYDNVSKMQRLGVQELTLKQYGAVSKQTADEMARGLLQNGNCDVVIATTGIAGPKSDNTLKPVGLCYVAIGIKEGVVVYEYHLNGDRKTITETAINHALFLAYKTIK